MSATTPGSRRRFPLTARTRTLGASLACAAALWVASTNARLATTRFYSDDPIWRDPETQDASKTAPVEVSDQFDLIDNSFLGAGDDTDQRALNINTVDEVPDSSWFTNRIGDFRLKAEATRVKAEATGSQTIAEIVKGPGSGAGPAPGTWTITGRKSEGVTPGFTITDSTGETYWIKFDPKGFPEMASGAEVISTKFFHAFGYHVPENVIATFRRESLAIAPDATMKDEDGRRRKLTDADLDEILQHAARQADGSYRVLASRNLSGRVLGPFRYYGTRPDDPNDIFAHEHRRELRGLSVFAAWLNHDEVRSSNSLDTVVPGDGGRQVVRHHLLDFGSTLGSGSVKAQSRRAGNEFVWESRPTLITMLTLGFYVRPWIKVDYPDIPAVGRFESTYFRPELWKPDYPNPAFANARADDRFWAARLLAAVSDDAVAAVVKSAGFSDAKATEYLTKTLLERKSKILAAWLNGTNPLVNVALSAAGELTFENAAERAAVAKQAEAYTLQWSRFDNAAGTHQDVGAEERITAMRAQAPKALLDGNADYIAVQLRAIDTERPAWAKPLVAYFHRAGGGWTLVGLDRAP